MFYYYLHLHCLSLYTTSQRQHRTVLNSHIITGRRALALVHYRLGKLIPGMSRTESCDWRRACHVTAVLVCNWFRRRPGDESCPV